MDTQSMIFKLKAAALEWPNKQLSARQMLIIADQLEYLELKISHMTGNMHMKDSDF